MSPIARNFYLGIVIVGVLAYLSFVGYHNFGKLEYLFEQKSVSSKEDMQFMRPLSDPIVRYASSHGGNLPKTVPIPELLANYSVQVPYLAQMASDPQVQVKWNNAVSSFQQCKGGRYIILWVEDARRKHYASALVSDGERCQPEVVPKFEVAELSGESAVLK